MIPPPKHIPAGRLFRLLLARPYAVTPIVYRIRGAEHIPLRVRALSASDEMAIADVGEARPNTRASACASELVRRALLAPGGPAFASAEEVDQMPIESVLSLAKAVREALNIISPTYALAEVALWDARLKEGARANWSEAIALGGCSDIAFGFKSGRLTERPDRYFGLPLADMTDGQWMAYRAARAVYEENQKK